MIEIYNRATDINNVTKGSYFIFFEINGYVIVLDTVGRVCEAFTHPDYGSIEEHD